MPTNKLTIVPVKLDPITDKMFSMISSQSSADPSCVIKTATAEISFFNNADERIIQSVMKELNNR
ncbi:hypothetical protein [Rummeliibacillus sp. SL167]|uniref:hypothetical protein n=1 Tax=Rummeliibacillus sp. SL167 TaxID=2579792 RepID=UPI0011B84DC3|nr:hypothetical protein [Rummeliibacillus sp. SL167]